MVEPQDPILINGQIWLSEPMTFLTDAILAICCWWWAATFAKHHPNPAVRPWWVSFFALMGIATFIGGVGHGLSHTEYMKYIKIFSGIITAISVFSAEIASIKVLPQPIRRYLMPLPTIQLIIFTFALITLYDLYRFEIVKLDSVIGLIGVVAPIHVYRHFTGQRGSGVVALGIFSAIAAALVSNYQIAPHKWFNHHDLGHLCMVGSLWLMYRGAKATE